MKIFLGIFPILLLLAAGILGSLAIWDIYPVSGEIIWKSGAAVIIASITLSLLWMMVVSFFKKEKYSKTGNKAHRMNGD